MAIKANQQKKIEELSQNIVNSMFETFSDKKNQGANFSWEKFPEIVKDLAVAYSASTFFKVSGEKLAEIEKAVGERTIILAQEKIDKDLKKKSVKKS